MILEVRSLTYVQRHVTHAVVRPLWIIKFAHSPMYSDMYPMQWSVHYDYSSSLAHLCTAACNPCSGPSIMIHQVRSLTYEERHVSHAVVHRPDVVEQVAVVTELTTPSLRQYVISLMLPREVRMVEERLTSSSVLCADERAKA